MKNTLTTILSIGFFCFSQSSLASQIKCNRDTFTHEQLSYPYAASLKKTLNQYSGEFADKLVKIIIAESRYEANRGTRPCIQSSRSCQGESNHWNYSAERILNPLGRVLGYSGEISSKQSTRWPANNKYYEHLTSRGYTCVWGTTQGTQCIEWCSLTVSDGRFHD